MYTMHLTLHLNAVKTLRRESENLRNIVVLQTFPGGDTAAHAANRNSRTSSSRRFIVGSGARHMVLYVSKNGRGVPF